jgi:hypothetical protein
MSGLPDFDPRSWQSTIRDRVAVHEQYQHLTSNHEYETTNTVYSRSVSQRLPLQGREYGPVGGAGTGAVTKHFLLDSPLPSKILAVLLSLQVLGTSLI